MRTRVGRGLGAHLGWDIFLVDVCSLLRLQRGSICFDFDLSAVVTRRAVTLGDDGFAYYVSQ